MKILEVCVSKRFIRMSCMLVKITESEIFMLNSSARESSREQRERREQIKIEAESSLPVDKFGVPSHERPGQALGQEGAEGGAGGAAVLGVVPEIGGSIRDRIR